MLFWLNEGTVCLAADTEAYAQYLDKMDKTPALAEDTYYLTSASGQPLQISDAEGADGVRLIHSREQ